MKYRILLLLTLCLGMLPGAQAQQEPQFSHYRANMLTYNPSVAGSRDGLSVVATLRGQWFGIERAPRMATFLLHLPSRNYRHGFGFSFIHDRLGITQNNVVGFDYAYRIPLGNWKLALGLRGGFSFQGNDFSQLTYVETETTSPGDQTWAFQPQAGTGIYLFSDLLYFGVSIPNLIPVSVGLDNGFEAQQRIHLFGTMGGTFPLNEKFDLRPSVVMKYTPQAPVIVDMNLSFFYKETLGIGIGYRTLDAMVFMLQYVNPQYNFRIGYAYDYTLSRLTRATSGSHELMLGYDLRMAQKRTISPRKL